MDSEEAQSSGRVRGNGRERGGNGRERGWRKQLGLLRREGRFDLEGDGRGAGVVLDPPQRPIDHPSAGSRSRQERLERRAWVSPPRGSATRAACVTLGSQKGWRGGRGSRPPRGSATRAACVTLESQKGWKESLGRGHREAQHEVLSVSHWDAKRLERRAWAVATARLSNTRCLRYAGKPERLERRA